MEMEVTTRVINPILANPSEMLLITCCLSSPFYDTIASQVMSKLSRFYAPSITQASEHLDDVDDLFGGKSYLTPGAKTAQMFDNCDRPLPADRINDH